ncbi:hypothetical protein RFI_08473 [Reticulomyxa filosa]|uniref:Uncharacterized protein n=1 Tax=Reticulomyxa filosa TaxID=46433 RepID=X6NTN2_RETFI|nr:hypothetical protein RFI_08473 [Reticulomyxa filosa]|eukprot:ETO28657.1 hypothetical protein RFI_08473 [Reticulomyxa filosa]
MYTHIWGGGKKKKGIRLLLTILSRYNKADDLCVHCFNTLISCMHSDKNDETNNQVRKLICDCNGDKICVLTLQQRKCQTALDEVIIISALTCIANMASVSDNIGRLLEVHAVTDIMSVINDNLHQGEVVKCACVALCNLSSDRKASWTMWHQYNVYVLLMKIVDEYVKLYCEKKKTHKHKKRTNKEDEREPKNPSSTTNHPDIPKATIMSIQQYALGCIGNMMRDTSNVIPFMANQMYKHIYNVMQCCADGRELMKTCLKLLNILITSMHTSRPKSDGVTLKQTLPQGKQQLRVVHNAKRSGVFLLKNK